MRGISAVEGGVKASRVHKDPLHGRYVSARYSYFFRLTSAASSSPEPISDTNGSWSEKDCQAGDSWGYCFRTLLYRPRQRQGLRVFAMGQRLRRFADHVAYTAGEANGERVRQWFQDKIAGWYAVLEDPQMPATSTLLDQAHHAIDRKLFMMKAFHHPAGSQQAFLTGLAHLYNLVPYQRRAKHAGQCGVEVEGGRVPTRDWLLNLQILTSGGFR